jgi:hypothetical protein
VGLETTGLIAELDVMSIKGSVGEILVLGKFMFRGESFLQKSPIRLSYGALKLLCGPLINWKVLNFVVLYNCIALVSFRCNLGLQGTSFWLSNLWVRGSRGGAVVLYSRLEIGFLIQD